MLDKHSLYLVIINPSVFTFLLPVLFILERLLRASFLKVLLL
jgi:hypothetical protein